MACKSILVVEDDPTIREVLKESLEIEGYQVHTAAHGKEALELLGTLPGPCLILLDLMMPVMNGIEFLEARKQDVMLAPIPVVVVSAFKDMAEGVKAEGFVRKPVDLELLLPFVRRYCG